MTGNPKASRFREAREYLGFSRDDVDAAIGWPEGSVAALEDGSCTISGEHLRKLSRLYRRSAAWLRGETAFTPDPALLRSVENLTPGDREAILDFAEFLQGAGPAPKPKRRSA